MKKIYYSPSCSTCVRVLKELSVDDSWEKIDIKKNGVSKKQVEEMKKLSKSYEGLFSKRSALYRKLDLKNRVLKESDIKEYIMEDYTFLLRPTVIVDNVIAIGSSKAEIQKIKDIL